MVRPQEQRRPAPLIGMMPPGQQPAIPAVPSASQYRADMGLPPRSESDDSGLSEIEKDLARTKRNVAKMVAQNAPESDIDAYIASEGYTLEQVRNFRPPEQRSPSQRPRTGLTIERDVFRRVPTGDTPLEEATFWPRQVLQTGADLGAVGVKAARDAAVGVATLPSAVLGPLKEGIGLMPPGSTEKKIQAVNNLVPDIKFTGPRKGYAEAGSEIAQFAVPGMGAARGMDKFLRGAQGKKAEKFLRGAESLKRILADMFAAGAADFAVTDPDTVHTIGNWIGGPTEIRPDDSPLARRTKIGAEATAFQGALGGLMRMGKAGYDLLRNAIRPLVAAEGIADELARKTLQDFVHDQEGAAQRLAERIDELSQGGFKPTAGALSGDTGLLQLEKGLRRKPGKDIDVFSPAREFGERTAENEAAISRQLREVTDQPGISEDARGFFREERAAELDELEAAARKDQEALEQGVFREQDRLAQAQAEVDDLARELETGAAGRTGAAKELDRVVREELTSATNRKNELARAIDPGRQLVVDDALLRETFEEIRTPKGPFDLTPDKLPQGLMRRIERFLSPDSNKPLTFGDLQDIRPEISEAIKLAQTRGQQPAVNELRKLRSMLNEYTVQVAEEAAQSGGKQAAMSARRFLNYYRDVYVPKWKQGAGGDIHTALRRGEEIAPETVPGRFIKSRGGTQTAAEDLRRIVREAQSPAEANRAVRDYLVTDFANFAVDPRSGRINKAAIRKYLADHRDALRQFPDVRAEIEEMAKEAETALGRVDAATAGVKRAESDLQKAVKKAADDLKQNERQYQQGVAAVFLKRDPASAVGRVLNSADPDKGMAELVRKVRDNPDALEGLRAATGEYLAKKLRGGRMLRTGEDIQVMSGRVLEMMRDPQKVGALRTVFGQDGVNVLDRINKQLQTAGRVHENLAAGMPTHLAREATRPVSLALDLHFGIMRGRRYLNFMNFIRTKILGGKDIETLAEETLTRMMLDPAAARIGLLPAASEPAQRRLATYVMNNILAGPSDEERRQRLLESQETPRLGGDPAANPFARRLAPNTGPGFFPPPGGKRSGLSGLPDLGRRKPVPLGMAPPPQR